MTKRKKSSKGRTDRISSKIRIEMPTTAQVTAGLLAIVIMALLAYLPALDGGFVMDDSFLITNNKLVNAPDGLYRIWFTTQSPDYWPVTNTMFWVQWRLWGTNTTGYHVVNLILHIAACMLIWNILRKLSIPGAFLAALIFAVHPVNVESVAWISQCKNTISMVFFLLSIFWFLKAEIQRPSLQNGPAPPAPGHSAGGRSRLYYWLSLAAFILAMLSKGSVIVLPVLLLGVIWWLYTAGNVPIYAGATQAWLAKMGLSPFVRDLARTAPFFAVAIILGGVNVWFQTHGLEVESRTAGFTERLLGAGGVTCFYLYKAFLPINLIFIYPQWHISAGNLLWWLPLAAVLALTVVLWLYRKSWSRPFLFAWGFFCVALAPVMGFSDVGFMKSSLVADHYQHIAIIGVIALASAGLSVWRRQPNYLARRAAIVFAVLAVGVFALLSMQQSRSYKDAFGLYETTLKNNPNCWLAHNLLSAVLLDADRYQEAIEECRQALRIKTDYADAYYNMANAYEKMKQYPKAIENYQQALRLCPSAFQVHYNLAGIFKELGQFDKAVEHYRKAIYYYPQYYAAYVNLGVTFLNMDRPRESVEQFRQAALLEPGSPEVHQNIGLASLQTGQPDEAIKQLRQAILLKPDYYEAYYNLGNVFRAIGQNQEAIENYEHALRLNPNSIQAHNNLGSAFFDTGQLPMAIENYRQALVLKPDYIEARKNLAAALVKTGLLQEAARQYRQVLQLRPDWAEVWCNLALAYAGMNQSSEAIDAAQKALELAGSQGQTELVEKIGNWLESYRLSLTNTKTP